MWRTKIKKTFFFGLIVGFGISFLLLTAVAFFVSDAALAQVEVDPEYGTTFGLGTADLKSTVIKIVQWALGFLGLIAVIMIMYGGFVWMTAAGNTDKVAKAKKIIIRAAIGLAIVLLAWAITLFIMKTMSDITGGGVSCVPGSINPPCDRCNLAGDGWFYDILIPGCAGGADTFHTRWVDPDVGETKIPLCSIIQAKFNGNIRIGSINPDPDPFVGNVGLYVQNGIGNGNGALCLGGNADCASGVCTAGACVGDGVAGIWQLGGNSTDPAIPAECHNFVLDPGPPANETDIDCGGACVPCANIDASILEFLPDTDYLENEWYQVELRGGGAGGIEEVNPPARLFAGKTWQFQTGSETLSVPPIVTNINPLDDAADICLNTPIQAMFSSKMRVSSINMRRCSLTTSQACSVDFDCPGGETCIGTVEFEDLTGGSYKLLKSPFGYPSNKKSFSTRPAAMLDSGNEYEVRLIAGDPVSSDPNDGIMDVCLNHLDGNENAVSDGTAGGDDFMTVNTPNFPAGPLGPPNPPTRNSPPWSFFADTDTSNIYCIPEITGIVPGSAKYDDPVPGPPGEVTISGSNFGITGDIFFNNGVIAGNTSCFDLNPGLTEDYPSVACIAGWNPDSIQVRVPGGPVNFGDIIPLNGAKKGPVVVSMTPGVCKGGSNDLLACDPLAIPTDCPDGTCVTDSNGWDFTVTSPQIKKSSGLNNQPHGGIGQYVTLSKRSDSNAVFGNTKGRVLFRKLDAPGQGSEIDGNFPPDPPCDESWGDDQVVIKVPDLAPIGVAPCNVAAAGGWDLCPVSSHVGIQIELPAPGLTRSNLIEFIYTNEAAGPGLCGISPNTCGTGGDPRTLGGENFGDVDGTVSFTLGVDVWNAPLQPEPPDHWNDTNINITVPDVDNAGDPYDVTVTNAVATSNGFHFTVPCGGVPEVDEDPSCDNYCVGDPAKTGCTIDADCGVDAPCVIGMASPNPYKNSVDVCTNAIMAARFTTTMSNPTLSGINIFLEECTDGVACTVPIPVVGALATFGPPFDDRFTFTPAVSLNTGTYYRMTIKKEVESSTGVKMNNDYEWVFKTKDDPAPCPVENIMVMPNNAMINSLIPPGNTQGYSAIPTGPNCTLVNPGDYTWAWESSNLGVATITNSVTNAETATSVAKGSTYIKAEAEGKSGQGLLKVDPDACAFNPNRCADPAQGGCAGSFCDVIADRCMPAMTDWDGDGLNFTPLNGPPGTTISVEGCWFGDNPGSIDIGGLSGDLTTCTNSWSKNLIVATTDAGLVTGAYHLIKVKTEAGRCNGGLNDGRLCTNIGDCPGGLSCDNFSTSIDGGQVANPGCPPICPYQFFATVNCARLCDAGSDNAYAYCLADADCLNGSCSAPAPADVANLPAGIPGLCPPLQPNTGKEGTQISIDGLNLGPPLNIITSRVYYPVGLADNYDDISFRSGLGAWDLTKISPTVVPVGAESGGVNVQVNNCPSNALPFGISCDGPGDCGTNCCKLDLVLGAKICKPFAECALPGPGNPCQIATNVPECQAGPIVSLPSDYRCIDQVGHLEPDTVAIPSELYPPPAGNDCRQCCDPDINNNGVLGEAGDQQVSATGLECTADVGNCDADERGLYCGCTADDQCQNPPTTIGCGLDDGRTNHCCYARPVITGVNPPVGPNIMCTNTAFSFEFNEPMQQSTMNTGNITMDDITIPLSPAPIPGKVKTSLSGFTFEPDTVFDPTVTKEIHIVIKTHEVKNRYGVAMSFNPGGTIRSWDIDADATLCQVDHIDFKWTNALVGLQDPPSIFTCGHDNCPEDMDAATLGNQQSWLVMAQDANGVNLAGIGYIWSENDPKDIFTVQAGCDPNSSCLITSDNKSGYGNLVVTADGTANGYGQVTEQARVNARMCSYPWPNPFLPDTDDVPLEDNFYNYSVWYCRGNELASLLPDFQQPGDLISQVFVAAEAGVDELLKQQFFLYRDDTISDDAIGIRIYENENGKSPEEWYWKQFGLAAPEPQSLTLDGYPAVRSGRTVYVAVWNLSAGVLYPNIYLISYNENASQQTIDIYNQMLNNWEFNIDMPLGDKEKLQRDMWRLNDLNDIYDKLLDYKGANGTFPKLGGGTYISTMTVSKWPSWQDALGAALGGNLPVDPINEFDLTSVLCDEASGFDQSTCWDDTNNQYQCPGDNSNTYIYQYLSSLSGESANLYANLEYLGPGSWDNGPPFGPLNNIPEPCDGISNAVCDCFNYEFDVTGNASDRQGPEIDSVDNLADGAVNVIAGTRTLDVDVTDTGSGVKQVEFYIDGFLKSTDADGGNGWSWDFVTTDYTNGDHTIMVRAYDNAGNWTNAVFQALVDNTGVAGIFPFVTILSPGEGNTISTDVTVSAQGSDNNVIISIKLELIDSTGAVVWDDGNTCVGNVTNSMTCSKLLQWDADGNTVPDYPNGEYILRARATDSDFNTSSHEISITIDYGDTNDPVIVSIEYYSSPPAPLNGATIFSQPTIRVNSTDDNAVNRVEFYVDDIFRGNGTDQGGNDWDWVWDTTNLTNGPHILTVYVYDDYGNNVSQSVTVDIANPVTDDEAPEVAFVWPPTPASGSSVAGTISIGAEATDNVNVKAVNFYVDYLLRSSMYATNSGYCENDSNCTDEASCIDPVIPPAGTGCGSTWIKTYEWDLNTDILTDGWHTIQVDAVDAAGNRSTSIETRVNVRGYGGPDITYVCVGPPSGAPFTTFTFYAEVADPEGVLKDGVKAYIQNPDEVNLGIIVDMDRVGGDEYNGQYEGFWTSSGAEGAFYVDIQAMDVDGNISEVDNIPGQWVCGTGAAPPACTPNGGGCAVNADCCSGNCAAGVCAAPPACTANGGVCAGDDDCCSGNCVVGFCAAAGGDVLFAVAANALMNISLFKYNAGDNTWADMGNPAGGGGPWSLVEYNNTLYVGTNNGNVYEYDEVIGWTETGNLTDAGVDAVTVHSLVEYNGTLYAATSSKGNVFEYDENADTWANTGNLTDAGTDAVNIHSLVEYNGTLYAATQIVGVLKYDENADTWAKISDVGGWVFPFAEHTDAAGNTALYAGTFNGNVYEYDEVIGWTETGNLTDAGVDASSVRSLVEYNGTLYAGTSPNGNVFEYDENADTWTNTGNLTDAGIDATNVRSLEEYNGTLYAGTSPNGNVFEYDENADTWTNTGDLAGANAVYVLLSVSGAAPPVCNGNLICEPGLGETNANCPGDCPPPPPPPPVCNNDGTCDAGEDGNNCPNDCGCCVWYAGGPQAIIRCYNASPPPVECINPAELWLGNGMCDIGPGQDCAVGCCEKASTCYEPVARKVCIDFGWNFSEGVACNAVPACVCNNNGTCDAGETNANCPLDCPLGCISDGCNGNCPAGCTVADDFDCGCQDGDGCCGIGCDSASDDDCICDNNGTCNYTTEDPANCPGDCNMGWCTYNCRADYGILNVRGDSCKLDGTCITPPLGAVDQCTPSSAQQGCPVAAEECCCLVNDPPGCIAP